MNVTELTQSQDLKEVTANEAFNQLAEVSGGYLSKSVAGGTDVTLTDAVAGESDHAFIELTGAITAAINVVFPDKARIWFILNSTTGNFALTCKTVSGTGVVVPGGLAIILASDATDMHEIPTGFVMPTYTVASAPNIALARDGQLIYVSNGGAGNPVIAFSDGTSWKRCDAITTTIAAS